ncbi:MAG: hypothetical protein BWY99_02760 [Synergistetes bacterium ADurb.BinA166]|nr:MAG: hypothetical protein BWY99_02760 [Synergistetes bacterium ADurb.BinA166]
MRLEEDAPWVDDVGAGSAVAVGGGVGYFEGARRAAGVEDGFEDDGVDRRDWERDHGGASQFVPLLGQLLGEEGLQLAPQLRGLLAEVRKEVPRHAQACGEGEHFFLPHRAVKNEGSAAAQGVEAGLPRVGDLDAVLVAEKLRVALEGPSGSVPDAFEDILAGDAGISVEEHHETVEARETDGAYVARHCG